MKEVIEVPKEQVYIHIIFEIIAVFILVPFLLWIVFSKKRILSMKYIKTIILIIALGTLVIDGGLLIRWFTLL